ncbi:hypothetical protein C8R47DRAFT_1324898 [Mycena vitilis]|nr:hypothetical protein C8R47DRAFT_1324898 [Mycena vitilis]
MQRRRPPLPQNFFLPLIFSARQLSHLSDDQPRPRRAPSMISCRKATKIANDNGDNVCWCGTTLYNGFDFGGSREMQNTMWGRTQVCLIHFKVFKPTALLPLIIPPTHNSSSCAVLKRREFDGSTINIRTVLPLLAPSFSP